MLRKLYLAFAGTTIVGYSTLALMGWEPTVADRDFVPTSVRSSPGGYRSFHFWHTGYLGGK